MTATQPPDRFSEARVIGYFLVLPLQPGKWEIWHCIRELVFCTYAETWEELEEEYLRQTAVWEKKLHGPKVQGQAWRGQPLNVEAASKFEAFKNARS